MELVDVVDEQDRVIGQVTRAQMRAQNLLHRNVAILCTNSSGEIYVHQRTLTKDLFPGLHDVFVGGVVSAGESYADAAKREIAEELGIEGPMPERLFHHRYEGQHTRSHSEVFRVAWDGPIRHQASEIAWGAYRTLAVLIENREGFKLVPDGAEIFGRYREWLAQSDQR
jgi:isopentenyldiphosphate isomerase